MSSVGKEVMWVRSLLTELGFDQSTLPPSILHCDNKAAVQISAHDAVHEKSKHIAIAVHWIRDAIAEKHMQVKWISGEIQEADILTKPLTKERFQKLRSLLIR